MQEIERGLRRLGRALIPGAYLVDTYPLLRHVPGVGRELRRWHRDELALYRRQVQGVKEKMVRAPFSSSPLSLLPFSLSLCGDGVLC